MVYNMSHLMNIPEKLQPPNEYKKFTKWINWLDRYNKESFVNACVSKIEYKRDIKDFWQTPQETIRRGKGDCEDIALFNYALLRQQGYPPEDVRLAIVFDLYKREYHAVLLARKDNIWFMYDNQTKNCEPVSVDDVVRYKPVYHINEEGVRHF